MIAKSTNEQRRRRHNWRYEHLVDCVRCNCIGEERTKSPSVFRFIDFDISFSGLFSSALRSFISIRFECIACLFRSMFSSCTLWPLSRDIRWTRRAFARDKSIALGRYRFILSADRVLLCRHCNNNIVVSTPTTTTTIDNEKQNEFSMKSRRIDFQFVEWNCSSFIHEFVCVDPVFVRRSRRRLCTHDRACALIHLFVA